MIKLEKTEVFGWDAAIRGMRNPMNSWDKSDTMWIHDSLDDDLPEAIDFNFDNLTRKVIGENDLKLMKNLSKAGNDHAKYLRMINVTVDITAPLYWWKEYDTYKVGTVANSCSTMHKIQAKEFTEEDFSFEHLGFLPWGDGEYNFKASIYETINDLNIARELFLETKDKRYWWQMIQLLPSSYNQKRTVQLNYQVLKSMYFSRRNHKLDEWKEFCKWISQLPYFREIILED